MNLAPLTQPSIDYFTGNGVAPLAIVNPYPVMLAKGSRGGDGIFEPAEDGQVWFAFDEPDGAIFWRPRTGEIAVERSATFAIGQELIDNPGTCALGGRLNIFSSPLRWLQFNRVGIVVLRWDFAFEWLRDVPRIGLDAAIVTSYEKSMRPRLPDVAIIAETEARAA